MSLSSPSVSDWDMIGYPSLDDLGGLHSYWVELGRGESAKSYSGIISSGALDSCIAIGLYDNVKEIGYMHHLSPRNRKPEEYLSELSDFLGKVDEKTETRMADSRVVLAGSNLPQSNQRIGDFDWEISRSAQQEAQRGIVERYFSGTSFENIESFWGEKEELTQLVLDIDRGRFYHLNDELL